MSGRDRSLANRILEIMIMYFCLGQVACVSGPQTVSRPCSPQVDYTTISRLIINSFLWLENLNVKGLIFCSKFENGSTR
jgi:hypothetical protein